MWFASGLCWWLLASQSFGVYPQVMTQSATATLTSQQAADEKGRSEEAALRTVVENYFAASGRKEVAGVVAFWSEKSPHLETYRQSLQQEIANEDLSYGSPVISRVKVEGEKASLRLMIAQTSTGLKSGQKSEQRQVRNIELVKEGGEWKVWRYASAAEDLAAGVSLLSRRDERRPTLPNTPKRPQRRLSAQR